MPVTEALELDKKVSDKAAAAESAAGNGGILIIHLDSALLLKS